MQVETAKSIGYRDQTSHFPSNIFLAGALRNEAD
jgi:hypothetical protein